MRSEVSVTDAQLRLLRTTQVLDLSFQSSPPACGRYSAADGVIIDTQLCPFKAAASLRVYSS